MRHKSVKMKASAKDPLLWLVCCRCHPFQSRLWGPKTETIDRRSLIEKDHGATQSLYRFIVELSRDRYLQHQRCTNATRLASTYLIYTHLSVIRIHMPHISEFFSVTQQACMGFHSTTQQASPHVCTFFCQFLSLHPK